MKFLKKALVSSLSLLMVLSASSAIAAGPQDTVIMSAEATANFNAAPYKLRQSILANEELSTVAPYAYMNLDTASEPLKDKILESRNIIIQSQSWSTDPRSYTKLPDGTIEYDPLFSDLFPGWDLPVWNTLDDNFSSVAYSIEPRATTDFSVLKIPSYYVPKYSASTPTKIMIQLRSTSIETFGAVVDSLTGSTCNIGISDLNGNQIKNKLRVPVGGECHIPPVVGKYYNIRVSTYDAPGNGAFRVAY